MTTFGRHLSEEEFIRRATAAWHNDTHPPATCVPTATAASSQDGVAATVTSADVDVLATAAAASAAPATAAPAGATVLAVEVITAGIDERPEDTAQEQQQQQQQQQLNIGCCNLCNKIGQLSMLRGAKHTCVVCLKLRWAGERKGISRGNIRRAIQRYGNQLPVAEFVQKTLTLVAEDAEAAAAVFDHPTTAPSPVEVATPAKRGRPRIGRRQRPPERSPSPPEQAASSEDESPPPPSPTLDDAFIPNGDTYRGPCIVCGFHRLLSRTHRLQNTCRRCMPARALCHQKGLSLGMIQRMYEELGGERMAPESFAEAAAAAARERSPGLGASVPPAPDLNSRGDCNKLELTWGRQRRVTEARSSSGMEVRVDCC
jgi:hypothetical protein